jgi:uracil-DNA glycosylase family 4
VTETSDTTRRALLQQLESLQTAGVGQLPRVARRNLSTAPLAAQAATAEHDPSVTPAPHSASPPPPEVSAPMSPPPAKKSKTAAPAADLVISKARSLKVLQSEVAGCTLCDELASTRTQTVFGVGAAKANLCFLGEAPGADEDRTGEPFVGRAGKLLNKIIEACTLRREEVYILNILKCRPPGNRNPTPAESSNCKRHLLRQLQLIKPEYICCLGAVAAQNLLQTTTPIGQLRGKVHDYQGIKVVCTYHPAYLLRNPAAKKDAWDDMKMLMKLLGVKL